MSAALNLLSFGLVVISNEPGRLMAYSARMNYKTANDFCVKYIFIELIIAAKVTGVLFSCACQSNLAGILTTEFMLESVPLTSIIIR